MTDKPEYQFEGEEKETVFENIEDSPTTPAKKMPMFNSKLILAVGVVVLLYGIGYIASTYDTSVPKESVEEVPSPIVKKVKVEKETPPPPPPQPVVQKFVLNQDPQFIMYQKQVQDEINQLKGANNSMVDRLKSILTELEKIQSSIKNAQATQQEMIDASLSNLKNEVYDLRARLTVVEDRTKPVKVAVNPDLKTFYLRGIIEGRAWITDRKGHSLSVKIGDELPDYGKVTGIFPNQGFVMTSSKRMIVFSKNDS